MKYNESKSHIYFYKANHTPSGKNGDVDKPACSVYSQIIKFIIKDLVWKPNVYSNHLNTRYVPIPKQEHCLLVDRFHW